MTETEFALSMLAAIVVKNFKKIQLNETDMGYISGVMEGFDKSSKEEQGYILNFSDMLAALESKNKGMLN